VLWRGGPSHIDTFDPRAENYRTQRSRRWPPSYAMPITAMGHWRNTLMRAMHVQQYGQAAVGVRMAATPAAAHGRYRSDPLVLGDGLNARGSVCQMNTGDFSPPPSMGAWVLRAGNREQE